MIVYWLASFPRSGNTWLRSMLAHLLRAEGHPLQDMQKLIPDLYGNLDWQALRCCEPLIVKTHDPFDVAVRCLGTGSICAEEHRPLLIVRNPLDVIASSFDFAILNEGETYASLSPELLARTFDDFVDEFLAQGGRTTYHKAAPVSLVEQLFTWRDAVGTLGGITVRYEDLFLNPYSELHRITEYIGLPVQPSDIRQAIRKCSFGELRKFEDAQVAGSVDGDNEFFRPWRQAGYSLGRRFFNKGYPGHGLERMSRKQVIHVRRKFADIFRTFGYQ